MKRCPLCDFIYEDDQSVCDMDGFELVQEGGALVHAGGGTRPGPPATVVPKRRRRPAQLLLGLGLVAALLSAYYVSVNQAAPTGDGQPSASSAARPAPTAVEPTPMPAAPTPTPTPAEMSVSTTEETTPAPAASPPKPAPEPRPAATPAGGKKARPGNEKKKKESKLTSILNKTGRMIKKPFGF